MITWDEPGCLGNIGQVVEVAGIAGEDHCGRFCWFIRPEPTACPFRYIDDGDGLVWAWEPGAGLLYHPVAWMRPLPDAEEHPAVCRVGNAEHREAGIHG
jgi:hypothetical protein